MLNSWKIVLAAALFISGPHSTSAQSEDFSSDLWVGYCNLEFLDAKLHLIRDVPFEEEPIIDLSVPDPSEYEVIDSCVLRTTYRGKVLDHPIGVSHFEEPGMTLEIRPKHTYMLNVRDFTMPSILLPIDAAVTAEPIALKGRSFVVPSPETPQLDKKSVLEMLAAAQAEASQHYGCKNMRTEELYERPRSKVRKGTSWAIEPDRTFLELVFRWDDGGPQENTLVLELEWEPRL
ncbi:MAG: hypothetical protein KDB95_13335 [Flavobacteriales bacterium]|nr:hypothetical protein [Flavobacteriales bacterium]